MSCRKYSHFSTAGIKTVRAASHHRDRDRERERAGWHLLNCQPAVTHVSSPCLKTEKKTTKNPIWFAPTFVFLQNILIGLKVFLLVRERTSLRCVLSHNPGSSNWTLTSGGGGGGQGHSVCESVCACVCMRVCVCVCVCVHVWVCVCAEDSRVIGAVVVPKETPYSPPLSAPRPMGDTSSPEFTGLIGRTDGRAALQEVTVLTSRLTRNWGLNVKNIKVRWDVLKTRGEASPSLT